jgi:O-methyltransferase involved in polyketide biosynthesis
MTNAIEPHPVADTAALVMLWASGYYAENPLIAEYLRRLDLSAGKEMFDRYNRICPWYSEAIVNRKHFISSSVRTLAGRISGSTTIVNLGAGFSPLALELIDILSPRCRFIEIDKSGMDRKHTIYAGLIPECGYISCLQADIADTSSLYETLGSEVAGHLIVVMEGLSYYVSREDMGRVFSTLSGLSAEQSIVFEHLKPCGSISDERRFIPYAIFSDVRDYTGLDRMTTYTGEEFRAMLASGFACRYYDMDEMERRRTGVRSRFTSPTSGWLSCAVAVRSEDPGVFTE